MLKKTKNFIINNRLILIIILAGAILRIGYSQLQLNPLINDSAMNAWEASHFFDNFSLKTLLEIPAHLEIFTWAVLFKIFGNNTFAYNSLGIIQYILSIFFYLVIKKIAGKKVALVSSFLLAFSPPIFTLNSVFWSGHSRGVMLSWIIFYLTYLICEKPTTKRFILLGLLSGFSVATAYNSPLSFALVSSLIVLILKDRKIILKREFFIFVIIFLISFLVFFDFKQATEALGYSPVNKTNFYNFNFSFFKNFIRIVRISFTVAGVTSTYQLKVGFQNGLIKIIYGLMFFIPIPFWLYRNGKIIFKFPFGLLIFPLNLFIFYSIYAFTGAGVATRYFLYVIPCYIYFLSDGLVKLVESNIKKLKILGFSAMFFIFAFSIADNLNFYPSAYGGIFELIKFAKQNNIKAIFTNYHMQFPIVFYSQETIAASSGSEPAVYFGSKFDEIVKNSPLISYLFEDDKSLFFEECLTRKKIAYKQITFGRLILYYSLSRKILPSECQQQFRNSR